MSKNFWHDIETGVDVPEIINVIVEIPKGSMNKYEYDKKKDEIIADDAIEFLNIAHLKTQEIKSLSSGEAQLALIAQALTQQSEIFIFDEPTANLDPANTKLIAKEIKNLKKNHQVILITHDIHLAKYFESSVLFIKDKQAVYFENNFFQDENLNRLYGVEFNNMVLNYG